MPKATPVFDITPKTVFPLPNKAFYKKMAEKAKKQLDKFNFNESLPLEELLTYGRPE